VFDGARNYDDPGLPSPEQRVQYIAALRRPWWRFARAWSRMARLATRPDRARSEDARDMRRPLVGPRPARP
jgi:hypothetical protein